MDRRRRRLNGLAVCAGIGGLELGLRLAIGDSYRTVGYVEREARAAAYLVARMGTAVMDRAPVWDDLQTLRGEPWRGHVDLLFGGIPCQPYSSAGRRLGSRDGRDLLDEFLRVCREVGPRYAFVENVAGFSSLGLGRLLGGLADLGFDAEWTRVSASDVGAPHERKRIFVLAYSDERRLEGERGGGLPDRERSPHGDDANRCDLWPPGPGGDWSGVPPEAQPAIRGALDGFPSRMDERYALRALGNGAVPLVVAYALRTLLSRIEVATP